MLNELVGLELWGKGVVRGRGRAGWFIASAPSFTSMTLEGERYSFGGLNMPFIPSDKWTQDLVTNQATVGAEAHEYHAHPTLDPQVFVNGLLSWWMAEHH